jgi:hypothetical protein
MNWLHFHCDGCDVTNLCERCHRAHAARDWAMLLAGVVAAMLIFESCWHVIDNRDNAATIAALEETK